MLWKVEKPSIEPKSTKKVHPFMSFFHKSEPVCVGPITIQSMDDLDRLQGRYPENFVLISQLKVCQEGGSTRAVLGGH